MSSPPAWHPDPSGAHDHRYWDGERWTEHVADAGVAAIDPLPDAPAADGGAARAEAVDDVDPDAGAPRDTEVITPRNDDASTPQDTEVIAPWDEDASTPQDTEVITSPDGHAGSAPPAAAQPGPPTGAPIGSGQPGSSGPGGATAAAPPGGGAAPPSWAGHGSSGPGWGTTPSASTGLATTALVLGILSLPLLIVFGLGALLGIAAIVVGIVALRRVKRGEAGGRGMAIGGIATGAVSVVLGILIVIALVAFGFGFADELERCIEETGSQAVCQERLERELTDRFLGD